jgi:hypothetical protein
MSNDGQEEQLGRGGAYLLPSAKSLLVREEREQTDKLGLFPTLVFLALTPETSQQLAEVVGSQLKGDTWTLSFPVVDYNQTLLPTSRNNDKYIDSPTFRSDTPSVLPAHISLSKTVFLADVYRESFLQTLKTATSMDYLQLIDRVQKLELFPSQEKNDEYYLGLVLESKLVHDWIFQVDQVMKRFHLPTYYQPARPHVTVAKSSRGSGNQLPLSNLIVTPQPIRAQGLYCLIGCKIYSVY